jgi:hypothetical protein
MLFLKLKKGKYLGRQRCLDEHVLGSRQIGSRIFAETELQAMLFLTSCELIAQMIPSLGIVQLECLNAEALIVSSNGSEHPNRATDDQTWNRCAARCASFMPANRAKALLQRIIGRRHIREIIGVEQTRSIVGSDLGEALDHIPQGCNLVLVVLHHAQLCLQLLLHPGSIEVVMVLQDGGYLMNPLPSDLQSRPQRLRLGQSRGEQRLELG